MTFPFSSRTMAKAVRAVVKAYTKTEIATLALESSADPWAPESPPNKEAFVQGLLTALKKASEDGDDTASEAARELVRLVLSKGAPTSPFTEPSIDWQNLRASLVGDGWEYDAHSCALVASVPGVDMASETSGVETALAFSGWHTAAGHYGQALDAFGRGNWASANAQLRNVLEDTLLSAAERAAGTRPSATQAALDVLQKNNHLVDGEYGYAKGLWAMVQPRGSHVGLSDEDEARFRLVAVTAYLRFLLSRI